MRDLKSVEESVCIRALLKGEGIIGGGGGGVARGTGCCEEGFFPLSSVVSSLVVRYSFFKEILVLGMID